MTAERVATNGFRGWPSCEVCGKALHTWNSVLEVDQTRANDLARVRLMQSGASTESVDLFEVGLRAPAHWRWAHKACEVESPYTYWISLDRLDNYGKVLGWMEHLGRKPWFRETDWFAAIGQAWAIDRGLSKN
jgi:hypothetical protein